MPLQEDFKETISIVLEPTAPRVIIYSPINSARIQYTCKFIFNRVLQVNFEIVTDWVIFERARGTKINYSTKEANGIVNIIPQGLLVETGIGSEKPKAFLTNGMLGFFETQISTKAFRFDIFSSVFYFISRYEEYQSYEADTHKRFEAKESLLFKHNFHLKPVVDYWILELKKVLEDTYDELVFPEKKIRIISSIDVDNLYAFKSKGFLRTLGASLKDTVKLDIKNLRARIGVLLGFAKDPFDIYENVSAFCLSHGIPLVCFFLFKTGTKYDRTVDPGSEAFKKVFGILKKNKTLIGLHPSYNAAFKNGMLKEELENFNRALKEKVNISRQHYLRFDIRTTPQLLLKNGITVDFSMGFASAPGFRAGTSHPFTYFDFENEVEAPLVFVPFCAMDGAYFVYDSITPDEAFKSLMDLANEIKKTNGFFVSVFHERTFYNHLYPGFGTLYKNLHLQLKDL